MSLVGEVLFTNAAFSGKSIVMGPFFDLLNRASQLELFLFGESVCFHSMDCLKPCLVPLSISFDENLLHKLSIKFIWLAFFYLQNFDDRPLFKPEALCLI